MLTEDFKITCPCCSSKILIDHKTGAIVSHELPRGAGTPTFEQAVADNRQRKTDAEDLFDQAVREHEHKEELLEKKFKEAFDKAEKDGTRPAHPLDLD